MTSFACFQKILQFCFTDELTCSWTFEVFANDADLAGQNNPLNSRLVA